mmetsp:Transcript_48834/g.156417  ORF Transcript_48834/g.156417 Transcript_48834/m.156417 type:complete len:561 (+) Transcript_48834:303-1985(+)
MPRVVLDVMGGRVVKAVLGVVPAVRGGHSAPAIVIRVHRNVAVVVHKADLDGRVPVACEGVPGGAGAAEVVLRLKELPRASAVGCNVGGGRGRRRRGRRRRRRARARNTARVGEADDGLPLVRDLLDGVEPGAHGDAVLHAVGGGVARHLLGDDVIVDAVEVHAELLLDEGLSGLTHRGLEGGVHRVDVVNVEPVLVGHRKGELAWVRTVANLARDLVHIDEGGGHLLAILEAVEALGLGEAETGDSGVVVAVHGDVAVDELLMLLHGARREPEGLHGGLVGRPGNASLVQRERPQVVASAAFAHGVIAAAVPLVLERFKGSLIVADVGEDLALDGRDVTVANEPGAGLVLGDEVVRAEVKELLGARGVALDGRSHVRDGGVDPVGLKVDPHFGEKIPRAVVGIGLVEVKLLLYGEGLDKIGHVLARTRRAQSESLIVRGDRPVHLGAHVLGRVRSDVAAVLNFVPGGWLIVASDIEHALTGLLLVVHVLVVQGAVGVRGRGAIVKPVPGDHAVLVIALLVVGEGAEAVAEAGTVLQHAGVVLVLVESDVPEANVVENAL